MVRYTITDEDTIRWYARRKHMPVWHEEKEMIKKDSECGTDYNIDRGKQTTPIHMQVLFAVLLGLRRREINGVKYSDIAYINRTLRVQRQLGKKPNTTAEDFSAKTFTKQEIGLKTSSSYRTIPMPDYVFEAILEERKTYEKNRRRRPAAFQDLDYICCSSYGRPSWGMRKKSLR